MKLPGSNQTQRHDYLYCADGTITTGGTAQLLLPQSMSRSFFIFQNTSSGTLFLEFGSARATATLTSGAVTSCAITNGGFNFTKPPLVRFMGGGAGWGGGFPAPGNSSFLGGNTPGYPAPSDVAQGVAVLSGGSVASITITHGGSGYLIAPYVLLINNDLDPYGCAKPSLTNGIAIPTANPPLVFDASCVTTDPVAVFGAATSASFVCRWSD